jgi:hypothetical protein
MLVWKLSLPSQAAVHPHRIFLLLINLLSRIKRKRAKHQAGKDTVALDRLATTQAGPSNQRIYSFKVVDRENYKLALESSIGRPIGSSLLLFDLFSFDVPGGSGDIKAEIIDLFAAKLLNFIRNPFCIEKVLNSFPGVASYDPTDPALLADYRRIVSGKKPHQAHLCTELGISDVQYVEWLRLLWANTIKFGSSNAKRRGPSESALGSRRRSTMWSVRN